MVIRTTSSIARTVFAIALASIGMSLLPQAAARGQTPAAPAAEGAETAPPAARDENAAPADGGEPPAAPALDLDPGRCPHFVGVLAGREKDAAVAKQPEFRAFAARVPELVTCGAVRTDSDDACKVLDKDDAETCRRSRATFHELRAYPKGRSYLFDETKYQECKQAGGMPAPVCEALRKALRSGDPNQCVTHADFVALCDDAVRAGSLDLGGSQCATEGPAIKAMLEGQCRALVNLDPAACRFQGPHADDMAEQCRTDIEGRKSYGKGLTDLGNSGSPTERELAKAALNDADACKAASKSAMDVCLGKGSAATPAPGAGAETNAPAPRQHPPSPPPATKPRT